MHRRDERFGADVEALLNGKSEIAARLRAFDWTLTPLGPIDTWPRSLVGYVSMVLEMPTPAIIFWGPDQTQVYNAAYAVIMGSRHPKFFASFYRDCWPDTYPTIYPWMRKVLDHGEFIQVEDAAFTLTRHGFPEEAYFTFTFSPLRDDEGRIAGIFQPVVEVTDRVLSERRERVLLERENEARRQAELQKDRFATIFAQSPTPICVLMGPDYVIELANPYMCQIWGRRREEVIGRPLFEALPELRGQIFKDLLDGVLYGGDAYVGTEVVAKLDRRGDGTLEDLCFNFVYAPLRNANDVLEGVVTIALDVTEQVHAREHLRAAARTKDEFLAMLGHELRNPLAPMQTSMLLIRKKLPASPVGPHLDVIDRQLGNLAHIVNDLLEVSRVTQGLIELRRERVDVAKSIAAAVESTRPYLETRRHDVSVAAPMRPLYVMGDPVRLEQVIVNLLTNAGKYTEPGGRIQVIAERADGAAELRIRDDGIGIPAELLPRIFELFTQGSREIARLQGGLGIGLTIVRRLVELHGGTIEARSDGPGRGSEFVVRLPLAIEEPASEPAEVRSAHDGSMAGRRRRVLVVDDNRDAATSLAMLIDELGHETQTAFDGPAALRVSEAWSPELIILDIGLPGMDGYQVAQELKRKNDGEQPLLVALTGYGQESDRRKSVEAGFDRHLVKPVQPGVIEEILESLEGG